MRPREEDVEALRAFTATHDAPCPGCGYNLRGNAAGVCPECGLTLRLVVGTDRTDRMWVGGLAALALGCGFSMPLTADALGTGLSADAWWVYAGFPLHLLLCVGLLGAWLTWRRALAASARGVRRLFLLVAAVIAAAPMIAFVVLRVMK